jgi:hypothetical protein
MVRILLRVVGVMVAAAVLFYIADSLMWQQKLSKNQGFEQVKVSRVSVATLKGNKEEYYFDGTDTARCSVSTLPMITNGGWSTPCWYLKKHHTVETRY